MPTSPSAVWPLTERGTLLTCFTHSPSQVRYKLVASHSGGEFEGPSSYKYIHTYIHPYCLVRVVA